MASPTWGDDIHPRNTRVGVQPLSLYTRKQGTTNWEDGARIVLEFKNRVEGEPPARLSRRARR